MESTSTAEFDLAIIGGGINGAGIARDAAGRGLKVLLVEQGDLASGTSSASSKLVHGGLRYLEQYAVRLVREALAEREVLLRIAPHIVRPMRFVLPVRRELRSPLLLRIGLWLYDHLGRRRILPPTRTIDLAAHPMGGPLKERFRRGFEYSDCWVDDARLVVLNALDAAERGAAVRTRTRYVRAERGDIWRLVLDRHGRREIATARVLVNAAGPWIGAVAETIVRQPLPGRVRLDKGSHIVVPRRFDHDRGYIFQARDGRVVFALPYEGEFTLIGTTDQAYTGDPAAVAPSAEEIGYLCDVANDYFRVPVAPADVVWSYAGVRALYDDGSAKPQELTRDYHLVLDEGPHAAPVLTVIGGKITTYRRLAEAAWARMAHLFPGMRADWTERAPLPGGDFAFDAVDAKVDEARTRWRFLTERHARRLVRAYGTRIDRVIGGAASLDGLGECFGADLTAAEVRYLMAHEWARTADDVLWRRSKLGLHLNAAGTERLARFMADNVGVSAA